MVLTHPHLLTITGYGIWYPIRVVMCGYVWYQFRGSQDNHIWPFHGIWHDNCGDTPGVFENHDMELGDRYRSDNCGI